MRYLPFLCLGIFSIACTNSDSPVKELASLTLKEVSGIAFVKQTDKLWALEDSGNRNVLYSITATGGVGTEVTIANVKNHDWEDLDADAEGNLYIGDFGNNDNDRKNLAIYKVDGNSLDTNTANATAVTTFSYPEQTEFPPKKPGRIFDVEAFFVHGGNFYLFTKNRSSKFDGSLSIYKVPNMAGDFKAEKIGSLTTCGKFKGCAVTGAAISPDGKTAVLLASDKLWLLTGFGSDDFANAKMQEHSLGSNTQKEGICFKDNTSLLIADEKDKQTGGKLYEVKLADLK